MNTFEFKFVSDADWMYETGINYTIGDEVVAKDIPHKVIGKCTGFAHNDTCIEINGSCWGGKYFFMKSEWQEVEIIEDKK
jgi:hypothetical protein